MHHAQNVARLRRYFCGDKKCDAVGQAFGDQAKIAKALAPGGKGKVFCPDCGKPILLRDVIEEKFESPAVKEQVREMQSEGQAVIDNESRELLAVHHTGFIPRGASAPPRCLFMLASAASARHGANCSLYLLSP